MRDFLAAAAIALTIATNDDFGTAANLAQLQSSGFAPPKANP